jgi:hypothetical protein
MTPSRRSSLTINGQRSDEHVNTSQPRAPPYNADTTVAILGVVQAVISAESGDQSLPGSGDQEYDRLLENGRRANDADNFKEETFVRGVIWAGLTVVFILGLGIMLFLVDRVGDPEWVSWWTGRLPKNPTLAAQLVMKNSPVIVCYHLLLHSNRR